MDCIRVSSFISLLMIMYALLLFVILEQTAFLHFKSHEELLNGPAILHVFYTVALTMTLLMSLFHAPHKNSK